jgi:hypothetical protein
MAQYNNILDRYAGQGSPNSTGVSAENATPTAPLKREFTLYINNTFEKGTYEGTLSTSEIQRLQDATNAAAIEG